MNGKKLSFGTHHLKQAQDEYLAQLPVWMQGFARFLLVKYGDLVTDARGSMAGNTHARNRFGNYIRARTTPVNPRSSRQMAARVAIMMLAEQWRESPMTDVIRGAWETYAGSVDWNNKLGETVTLTGFNHFIRSNAALIRAGATIVTAGPTDLGLPAGDPAFAISNASAAGNDFDMAFDDGFDWCDEDDGYLILDIGQPQNATRNYFNGPWRFNFAHRGNLAAPPVSPQVGVPSAAWTLIEGQKLWARASIIREDARMSTKFQCAPFIVGA